MQAIQTNAVQVCNRRWVKSLVALFLVAGLVVVDGPGYAVQAASNSTILGTTGKWPQGIAIDTAGNVYTANLGTNDISKITPAGVSTILSLSSPIDYSKITLPGEYTFSGHTGGHGIVVDTAGNIYTTDSIFNSVVKITPDGVAPNLGPTGERPFGIVLDAAGNIYTANSLSNNVSKITPAGVSTILGKTGQRPIGIAIDAAGNIYTTNYLSDNVSKITPAGVSTILGKTGSGPEGIVVDAAGNIYTANNLSDNVSKITPAGISTILGKTGWRPVGIVVDAAGNVYTANGGSSNVSKITPAGISTILGKTGKWPYGIVLDAAGNIYTANNGSSNVSKITPTPSTKKPGARETITCKKGKVVKKVAALKPVCPKGYKKT